ncbi:MAG TPA: hypothetical protein VGH33_25840 [Isosphaeraceae bacterium]
MLRRVLRRSAPALLITVVVLTATVSPARAQFYGFGGYGYPGMAFGNGFGYPAYGVGYGYGGLGYGYGGFGYGGLGYGYGYPGVGYGYGFGYPAYGAGYGYGGLGYGFGGLGPGGLGFGYGSPGVGYGYGNLAYGNPYLLSGLFNPLFGVGMTPLGLQSYLYERNVLGRGLTGNSRGYSGYAPAPTNVPTRP